MQIPDFNIKFFKILLKYVYQFESVIFNLKS